MSYNTVSLYLKCRFSLILFKLNWERKFRDSLSQLQRTEFWSTKLFGHHKIPTGEKKTQNLETVTETCLFLSVHQSQEKSCLCPPITVSPLWQKSEILRIFHKFWGGIHGCKTPTCVFSFVSDPSHRKHTQMKRSDLWRQEMLNKSGFTQRTGLQFTLKSCCFCCTFKNINNHKA